MTEDEFRVEVDLEEAHGFSLRERLRSADLDDEARARLGDRVIVTRDGPRLFAYARDEQGAREAERVIRKLVAADGLTAEISVTRWHPIAEAWQDASLPLPATDEERRAEYERKEEVERREAEAEGEFDWHVCVNAPGRAEAAELAEALEAEGVPVARRWRYVVAGAYTEEAAEELAERLRREAPADSEVWIEPTDVDVAAPPRFFFFP